MGKKYQRRPIPFGISTDIPIMKNYVISSMSRSSTLETIIEDPHIENDVSRGEYYSPIRRKKQVMIRKDVRQKVEEQTEKRRVDKQKMKEQKLAEIESMKRQYKIKINSICKKNKATHPALENGNQNIGYRMYIVSWVGIEWRVGRVTQNSMSDEYEYNSKWMEYINRALFVHSIEDMESIGYYDQLHIKTSSESYDTGIQELEVFYLKIKEDIEIDERVIGGIHEVNTMSGCTYETDNINI